MKKDVVIAGLFGGFVIFLWIIISQGLLPFRSDMIINTIGDQQPVLEILKDRISEPGIYVVPYLPFEETESIPNYGNQPIFSIMYTGATHNTVPGFFTISTLMIFIAPILAAWLLSVSSEKILSRYSSRVGFIVALGIFLALMSPIANVFEYNNYILFSMANYVVMWILAGLVIAWKIKPNVT